MAFPEYIPTRLVSAGGAFGLETGEPIRVRVRVEASRQLVWTATGQIFRQTPVVFTSEPGESVYFDLPRTDVAGWRDRKTNQLIDVSAPNSVTHTYRFLIDLIDEKGRAVRGSELELKNVAIPAGATTIDLDTLVPATTTTGLLVLFPDEWRAITEQARAEATAAAASADDAAESASASAASAAAAVEAVESKVDQDQIGAADGVAPLDEDGKLPEANVPDYLTPSALTTKSAQNIAGAKYVDGMTPEQAVTAQIAAVATRAMFPKDTITLGGDSTSTSWGSTLATLTGKSVASVGHGGQKSDQIAARSGAVRATVSVAGNVIPASGGVTITAASVNIITGASNYSRTGVLAGVYGTWSFDGSVHTFTRMLAGAATPCPAGSEFICTEEQYNDRTLVYSVGRNDPYTLPASHTANLLLAIKDRQESHVKRVLFLSILPASNEVNGSADRASLNAKNAACAAVLGESWADFASWIRTDEAFQAAEIVKTTDDITDINNGITPRSLRSDTLHLNAAGSKAQAWYAARQLYLRGWTTTNPPLPNPVPVTDWEPGVTGYAHRYEALASNSDNSTTNTWADLKGTDHLTAPGAGTRTFKTVNGIKYLEIKGTGSAALVGSTPIVGDHTVMVVFRSNAQPQVIAKTGSYQLQRAGNGWVAPFDVSPAAGKAADIAGDANWHVAVISYDNAASAWNYDGTALGAGTLTGSGTPIATALGGNAADTATDIAAVFIWPTVLDAAQRATVRAAAKAKYPALP